MLAPTRRRNSLPAWLGPVDRALALATREIRLICAATPTNAVAEQHRLTQGWECGREPLPAWRYESNGVRAELRHALEALADWVEGEPPLGPLYAARARELLVEASMVDAVGTPKLRSLARLRFDDALGFRAASDRERADRLAETVLAAGPEPVSPRDSDIPLVMSDEARDPRSLVSCMAAEIGRLRLPLRVVLRDDLASLAATGDGVLFVAPRRPMRVVDVRRTVLHEIAGHALPRLRAERETIGLFAVGTARGVDDQEGRALLLERAAGFLDRSRLRELSLRHVAARAMFGGATFVELVRTLLSYEASASDAVRIASRAMRGGRASGSGLGREIVYLVAMLRVERARAKYGAAVESMMRRGRIAAAAAPALLEALGDRFEQEVVDESA